MRTVPSGAGPVDAGPTVLTLRAVFDAAVRRGGRAAGGSSDPDPAAACWPGTSGPTAAARPLCRPRRQPRPRSRAFAGPKAAPRFPPVHRPRAELFAAFEGPVMQAPRPSLAAAFCARCRWRRPRSGRALPPPDAWRRCWRSHFTDPRLRQLFGRYATYVGGAPDLSPAVLALIWQAEARGVWAVQGGMHGLAAGAGRRWPTRGAPRSAMTRGRADPGRAGRVTGVVLSDGRIEHCGARGVQRRSCRACRRACSAARAQRRAAQRSAPAQPFGLGLVLCRRPAAAALRIITSFSATTRTEFGAAVRRADAATTPRFTSARRTARTAPRRTAGAL